MKRSQLYLATLALPVDYVLLVAAGLLAYELRFVGFVQDALPVLFDISFQDYLSNVLLTAVAWVVLFALSGLYTLKFQLKFSQEIGRVFLGCTAGLALIIVLFFFNPNLFGSRFIILVGWAIALLLVSLGRLSLRLVRLALYRRGLVSSRVLLVGGDATTQLLERVFRASTNLGYRVVATVAQVDTPALEKLTLGIDEVIIGDPTLPRQLTLEILNFCTSHHLGFKYAADMFEAQSHNVVTHTLAGVPLIEIKRTSLDGWGRVLKRSFDVTVSGLMLVILCPLWLLLGAGVVLGSGWPVVVGLERVGEHGRRFRLYKFRSMIVGADKLKPTLMSQNERSDGPLFKLSHDPRVTPFGGWLRRSSLDEFPQLWNVMRGDMSLVGPRPHEPGEVERYHMLHHKLLNLKPGMTGLAQVSGRSQLTFEEEAKLDMFYVENWSLAQDFVILVKTVVVVLQRQAAV